MATYQQLMDAARKADAAGDGEATKRFLELAKAAKGEPQTNIVEQTGTGASEGIASALSFPTEMLNRGLGALGMPELRNPEIGGVELPIFGTRSLHEQSLDPFMSDVEPQTAGQRIGRRIGQDVGAGATAAPLAGISTVGGMGMNLASDVASGTAGGLTGEVTDNPLVNAVVSMLAGSAVPLGSQAFRSHDAPSIDDLKGKARDLYKQVEESDMRLTPGNTQELQGNMSARMYDMRMNPSLEPRAVAAMDEAYDLGSRSPTGEPSLYELEELRRYIGRKVLPSQEPGEKELGLALRDEIDSFVDKAAVAKGATSDVSALKEARETTRRYKNAEALDDAMDDAGRAAGSSGSGGNTINANRQAVKNALLKGKQAEYLTPEETAEVDKIVRGTRTSNALRRAGGLSPTRGALPLAFTAGQMFAASSGSPAFLMPSGIGIVAQALGEQLTKRQINDLSVMLRTGAKPNRALSAGERAVLNALLASQAAQQLPQSGPQ